MIELIIFLERFSLDDELFYSGKSRNIPHKVDLKNVQLPGSYLIFPQKFVKHFDGVFSETFLCMEEDCNGPPKLDHELR